MIKQLLQPGDLLRYPASPQADQSHVDGFRNFFHATGSAHDDQTRVQLASGINAIAHLRRGVSRRRPAILLRSSQWKAGSVDTPWHDEFEIEAGTAVYFGDHKVDTKGSLGSTRGIKALTEAWSQHRSADRTDRCAAPPLIVFRAQPWTDPLGKVRQKGLVEFCGVATMHRWEVVESLDPTTHQPYQNYQAQLKFVDLGDGIDWSWINARRDPGRSDSDAALPAPAGWQRWIEG